MSPSQYFNLTEINLANWFKIFIDIASFIEPFLQMKHLNTYRTRAIIGRSRFEAALVYKPRILGLKNEEFPFLVHKLSVI